MQGKPGKYGVCLICGKKGKVLIHHKDGNHGNDVPGNRQALCSRCHSLVHVKMRIAQGSSPGTRPLAERIFEPFPSLSWTEVKKQYFNCFPRG